MPNQPKLRHAAPFVHSFPNTLSYRDGLSASHHPTNPRAISLHAIAELVAGLAAGEKDQTLLGVTGSGKTFTMAKIIEGGPAPRPHPRAQQDPRRPALPRIQISFFPTNAVEYFVSYYDYYQPEAYIPAGDLFIEKEATINEELDKLRLSATRSLFERRDYIIVSSVSCIYGLGSPEAYYGMLLLLEGAARKSVAKTSPPPPRRNPLRAQRRRLQAAAPSASAATSSKSSPPTTRTPTASNSSATRSTPSPRSIPSSAPSRQKYSRLPIYPKSHYVVQPERKRAATESILNELGRSGKPTSKRKDRLPRVAAHSSAHPLRPGDARVPGLLPRHRELLPPSLRPPAGVPLPACSTTSRATICSSSTSPT